MVKLTNGFLNKLFVSQYNFWSLNKAPWPPDLYKDSSKLQVNHYKMSEEMNERSLPFVVEFLLYQEITNKAEFFIIFRLFYFELIIQCRLYFSNQAKECFISHSLNPVWNLCLCTSSKRMCEFTLAPILELCPCWRPVYTQTDSRRKEMNKHHITSQLA